jgi:hypothetical protein
MPFLHPACKDHQKTKKLNGQLASEAKGRILPVKAVYKKR